MEKQRSNGESISKPRVHLSITRHANFEGLGDMEGLVTAVQAGAGYFECERLLKPGGIELMNLPQGASLELRVLRRDRTSSQKKLLMHALVPLTTMHPAFFDRTPGQAADGVPFTADPQSWESWIGLLSGETPLKGLPADRVFQKCLDLGTPGAGNPMLFIQLQFLPPGVSTVAPAARPPSRLVEGVGRGARSVSPGSLAGASVRSPPPQRIPPQFVQVDPGPKPGSGATPPPIPMVSGPSALAAAVAPGRLGAGAMSPAYPVGGSFGPSAPTTPVTIRTAASSRAGSQSREKLTTSNFRASQQGHSPGSGEPSACSTPGPTLVSHADGPGGLCLSARQTIAGASAAAPSASIRGHHSLHRGSMRSRFGSEQMSSSTAGLCQASSSGCRSAGSSLRVSDADASAAATAGAAAAAAVAAAAAGTAALAGSPGKEAATSSITGPLEGHTSSSSSTNAIDLSTGSAPRAWSSFGAFSANAVSVEAESSRNDSRLISKVAANVKQIADLQRQVKELQQERQRLQEQEAQRSGSLRHFANQVEPLLGQLRAEGLMAKEEADSAGSSLGPEQLEVLLESVATALKISVPKACSTAAAQGGTGRSASIAIHVPDVNDPVDCLLAAKLLRQDVANAVDGLSVSRLEPCVYRFALAGPAKGGIDADAFQGGLEVRCHSVAGQLLLSKEHRGSNGTKAAPLPLQEFLVEQGMLPPASAA